ncbi:MAG: AmmeMemoRadiSam system radical SAM enzyme [Firmicutes bacterium HGW-Firmicutes-13]|nr:MAG: AmmeMemoRadiSam system radical SAM enzyme [Firmicutes bacterium HGW-Firmicutes-13]
MFYKYDEQKKTVLCELCPHYCRLKEGQRGRCGVREHQECKLITLNYGECSSYALDPIEKKPLYHFYPGSQIFSIGTLGCNFSCSFCQNWSIAQNCEADTIAVIPEDILEIMETRVPKGQRLGVAYTYNEPTIWYEFVYDTAKLIHEKGMKNVLVTNGFINREPLEKILPYIDAMNIDVKGFTDNFYRNYCGGRLNPVMETVEVAASQCHVEVTSLIIPTLNDSMEEIGQMVRWLAGISPDIPLHFSRYFPGCRLELYPTPVKTLEKARELARERLNYVYIGNVQDNDFSHTRCPGCGKVLIRRTGYMIKNEGLDGHTCKFCGEKLNFVSAGVMQ